MFKCLPFALVGGFMFLVGSSEAQLFRRFAVPHSPAVPSYSPGFGGQQYVPQRQLTQPQQPTYYQRVQVAPGRFAMVPVQANGGLGQMTATPQDIARNSAAGDSANQAKVLGKESATEEPQARSPIAARTPVASPNVPQTQQRYQRVTVYNARTGQRSTRLIPIPSTTLKQQPHVYGQSHIGQGVASPKVVTGKLVPPVRVTGVENPSDEIRFDPQVQPASLVGASVIEGKPQLASVIPVSPEPQLAVRPQPAAELQSAVPVPLNRAETATHGLPDDSREQYSVLVFDEELSDDSTAGVGVELSPPAN